MLSAQIQDIVAKAVAERFPKVHVLSINVRDVGDEDGDRDEVEINIVFQASKDAFDPKHVPAFVTAVIEALEEAHESRFPIFSFIAKSDLGKRKPEAA